MRRNLWIFGVLLLVAAICQSNAEEQLPAPLKRSVRSIMQGLSDQMFERVKSSVVKECKDNGYSDEEGLNDSIDEAKSCIKSRRLFLTPKDDFLAHIDSCSQDAVNKVRGCLPEERKYFPDFVHSLMKSVTSMMYDDYDIMRVDLAACVPTLVKYNSQMNYLECLKKAASKTGDDEGIPASKTAFCKRFLPATHCFSDWIKDSCSSSENLKKFAQDYFQANSKPCESKEVNSV